MRTTRGSDGHDGTTGGSGGSDDSGGRNRTWDGLGVLAGCVSVDAAGRDASGAADAIVAGAGDAGGGAGVRGEPIAVS